MIAKFKKYFFPIPQVYLISTILNPSLKLRGANGLVRKIYENLTFQQNEQPSLEDCQANIYSYVRSMFDKYKSMETSSGETREEEEYNEILSTGSYDGMELMEHQSTLPIQEQCPREIIDKLQLTTKLYRSLQILV